MSDINDENVGVNPAEDPAGTTPSDAPAAGEPIVAASADEAPTGALPPAQEAPVAPPLVDQTAVTQPTVAEAPTLVQSPLAAPPRQSWVHRRWVPVVGAVAAAVVLLFGGVAAGSTLDGNGDRDARAAFGDRGDFRQDGAGRGGHMDGRGYMDGRGHMDGRNGVNPGCDEDDCPQLDAPQTPATP
ncbi:MAG TPA: hypothetical protein VFH61_06180 [Thermoleophilia bacterium]|nr:hypothetical protein [Thermoleophilia bacterium]